MLQKNDEVQKRHFNLAENQYDQAKIINPHLSQKLEINHLIKLLALSPPKKIMDFGAGTGRATIPLLTMGFDVWAVDVSRKSLDALTSIYQKQKNKTWGKLTAVNRLPQNIFFDAIVGTDILHHINIEEELPDLYRILKPNGLVVFSEPNAWHLPWYPFIFATINWSIEKGILQCFIPNLKKEFSNTGFREIKIEGYGVLPTLLFNFSRFLSSLNVTLGNLPIVKYFSFRLIVSAKK